MLRTYLNFNCSQIISGRPFKCPFKADISALRKRDDESMLFCVQKQLIV